MSRGTRLRNLALLGGLGAAAMMMGKKDSEDSDAQYEAQDKEEGYKSAERKAAVEPSVAKPKGTAVSTQKTPAAATGRSDKLYGERTSPPLEGVTASGLPREARGIKDTRTPGQKMAARMETASDRVRRARREQMGLDSDSESSYTPSGRTGATLAPSSSSLDMMQRMRRDPSKPFKKGGSVKSSASKRADGIASKGKTRGRII